MTVDVYSATHCTVVRLPAEVDVNNAGQVREELLRELNRSPGGSLIVDMTGTSFLAVAGVHVLVRVHGRATAAAAGLRVAVSSRIVRRVLEITAVDRLLEIRPSVAAAVASLPGSSGDGQTAQDGQVSFCPDARMDPAGEARR